MKSRNTKYTLLLVLSILWVLPTIAQTIWNGPITTFEKGDGADWTLAENQDRITDNVWITRASNQGIYNIATENGYVSETSPAGTEWAFGTTENLENLTFEPWEVTINGNPPASVGEDMVLHLIEDDIYIDLTFTSWANGMQGGQGRFSYERSTEPITSTDAISTDNKLELFPNPSAQFITVVGLRKSISYELLNNKGQLMEQGLITSNQRINTSSLASGTYFLRLENGEVLKFIKL